MIAAADPFIVVQRDVIIRLAETHRVPVIYPGYAVDQFELVINLKTVKTLGLTIPAGVLSVADEVIE